MTGDSRHDDETPHEQDTATIVYVDMVEVDTSTGTTRTIPLGELRRKRAPRKRDFSPWDMIKGSALLFLLGMILPLSLGLFARGSDFRPIMEAGSFLGSVLTGVFMIIGIVDYREGGRDAIGLVMPDRAMAWLKSVGYYFLGTSALIICVVVVVTFLVAFGYNFEGSDAEPVRRYYGAPNVFSFMSTVFAAPVVEEIIFRGVGLSGYLKTGSERRAIAWTSVIFALLHGPTAPFVFFTGVALAYIRLRTGSLYCAIAIHALHNMMVMFMRTSAM